MLTGCINVNIFRNFNVGIINFLYCWHNDTILSTFYLYYESSFAVGSDAHWFISKAVLKTSLEGPGCNFYFVTFINCTSKMRCRRFPRWLSCWFATTSYNLLCSLSTNLLTCLHFQNLYLFLLSWAAASADWM